MNITKSIIIKFNLITALLITVIFITFGTYEYSKTKLALERDFQNQSNQLLARLKLTLPRALWNLTSEQINQTLKSELIDENVQEIVIYDDEELTKFNSGKKKLINGNISDSAGITDKINYSLTTNLIYVDSLGGEHDLGMVMVKTDTKIAQKALSDFLIFLIIETLIFNIIVITTIILIFKHVVIKNIIHK